MPRAIAPPPPLLERAKAALGLARSLVVYWRPGRQRGLQRLYGEFLAPGDLAFDIGAHLGDRTAAFQALGAGVVALEPQPGLFRWLVRLMGERRGLVLMPLAAGSEEGEAEIAISVANPSVSTLAGHWRERIGRDNPGFRQVRWERRVTVKVTTLDALIARFGVPRFIKVDVEGFEAKVLAGLSQPVEALSVEFVAGALDVAEACVARLEALGDYRFNAIQGERRDFIWGEWRSPAQIRAWLADGADGLASGDLYARRQPSPISGETS
nr:FkbM family methyltransferase [Halomonas socia]